MSWDSRTELMVGKRGMEQLRAAHVLIVGVGGVGAYAAEAICRAGVGKITIVDADCVDRTNRNRQLPALLSTEGVAKVKVLSERFRDINPDVEVIAIEEYLRDDRTRELLDSSKIDYLVDCIDTLSPKVFLIIDAVNRNIPVVSSMGAGGKFDPTQIEVADLKKSYNCKLAKQVRKRLGRFGIKKGVKVVFSAEDVDPSRFYEESGQNKKSTVGTISYMPPAFGCAVASVVLRGLIETPPTADKSTLEVL